MSCPHCYAADWFKDHTKLTYDEVQSIVFQAKNLGCEKVILKRFS
jgi:MoaA/NifB/PqqE/SkfB family radical SAM enzyme